MFHPSAIHIVIVVLVIVLIFGAAKLPSVAKNLGKSMKVFRDEVKDLGKDGKDTEDTEAGTQDASPGSDTSPRLGGESDSTSRSESSDKSQSSN